MARMTEQEAREGVREMVDDLLTLAAIALDVRTGGYDVDDDGRVLNPDCDDDDARRFIGEDGQPAMSGDAVDVDDLPDEWGVIEIHDHAPGVHDLMLTVGGPTTYLRVMFHDCYGDRGVKGIYRSNNIGDFSHRVDVNLTGDEVRTLCNAWMIDLDELEGRG